MLSGYLSEYISGFLLFCVIIVGADVLLLALIRKHIINYYAPLAILCTASIVIQSFDLFCFSYSLDSLREPTETVLFSLNVGYIGVLLYGADRSIQLRKRLRTRLRSVHIVDMDDIVYTRSLALDEKRTAVNLEEVS